jgi:Arc/MetJ family transcription regulator
MRTTIVLDESVVAELMRAEKGAIRSEAIRRAIHHYLRRKREEAFMALAGSRLVELDWREAERQDMREHRETARRSGTPKAARRGRR